MRVSNSHDVDRTEVQIPSRCGQRHSVSAFSEQVSADCQGLRFIRRAAEVDRTHVRTVELHLDVMVGFRIALNDYFKLRSGVRVSVDIPERHYLVGRHAFYEPTKDIAVVAVEQSREIGNPLFT